MKQHPIIYLSCGGCSRRDRRRRRQCPVVVIMTMAARPRKKRRWRSSGQFGETLEEEIYE